MLLTYAKPISKGAKPTATATATAIRNSRSPSQPCSCTTPCWCHTPEYDGRSICNKSDRQLFHVPENPVAGCCVAIADIRHIGPFDRLPRNSQLFGRQLTHDANHGYCVLSLAGIQRNRLFFRT